MKKALYLTLGSLALFVVLLGTDARAQTTTISMQLDLGDTGADVTTLQTFLAKDESVYPEGLVTGFFGELTQKAVARFQLANNIVTTGFPDTTGFGRVGPVTLAKINQLITGGGTGGSDEDGIGDITAPVMGAEAVTRAVSGAVTITWTTNEPATSRLLVSRTRPFIASGTMVGSDVTLDGTTTITISGLQPATTYFYIRESVDLYGNLNRTESKTFVTL